MSLNFSPYETFAKNISLLLKEFEDNREWADLSNWLYKLQNLLGNQKFPQLPEKVTLSKRLAQCLHVNLPIAVHSATLNIYNTIFTNYSQSKIELLPLMSIGLFPFFEYSGSRLKDQLMRIFDEHFTSSPECLQMLVSLINSLLTGFNENSDELDRQIHTLCDKISVNYGRMWVDGAVWVNILKSRKVRLHAFKYFMKSFKDRDKGSIIKKEKQMKIEEAMPECPEKQMILNLLKIKQKGDTSQTRFPNFSSLIVNALTTCLNPNEPQLLVKRSALDMMIAYLKIENTQLVHERDAVQLSAMVLRILRSKQFSLTRRVYIYFFGSPNVEGEYRVQLSEYQYNVFKKALLKIFSIQRENLVNEQEYHSSLQILDTLITDHPPLVKTTLPFFAYDLLVFLRKANIDLKKIHNFCSKVIDPNSSIFVQAIVAKILSKQVINQQEKTHDVLSTLEYYLKINIWKEQAERKSHEILVEGLLQYLEQTNCSQEECTLETLHLCYQIYNQNKQLKLSQKSIEKLEGLIKMNPERSVYAGLLILHPRPSKEYILPYINEGSLSIICLRNLLALEKGCLQTEEIKLIFFTIFKLFNCHLWQDEGIQFAKSFFNRYPEHFSQLIDKVETSEWLIYWNKMNGNVEGGVLRMLRAMQHENPINRQLSKSWVQNSKLIVSKILDPVYKELEETEDPENILQLFRIIKNIFEIQQQEFVTYFFLKHEKYLVPLTYQIFSCFHNDSNDFKTKCISMLQFLFMKTKTSWHRIIFLENTLLKTVQILNSFIQTQDYLLQIQTLSYLMSFSLTFRTFSSAQHQKILKKIVVEYQLYNIVIVGMKETTVPYVRTLYLNFLQKSCEYLIQVIEDKEFMGSSIRIVLEVLFSMLKENDVTSLENIIKGKEKEERKRKSLIRSIEVQRAIQPTQLNVEAKYGSIIQLWNNVKLHVKVSIENQMHSLPTIQLLSLILESFPFSDLKYDKISPQFTTVTYEKLQNQIKSMTGLKKEVLEIFDLIWGYDQYKIIDYLIENGDPRILIHAGTDPNTVVKSIQQSSVSKEIAKYYKESKFLLPKDILHYNRQILTKENQLNYFIYLYILHCNLNLIKKQNRGSFLGFCVQFLQKMKISTHVQSKLWILQILYTLSQRLNFQEFSSESIKLKEEFKFLISQILIQLSFIVSRSKNFTSRLSIRTGFFSSISSKQTNPQKQVFDFVKIFPPSAFFLFSSYSQNPKSSRIESLISLQENYINQFLFKKWFNLNEAEFISYLSIIVVKTLNFISLPLLFNFYEKNVPKIALLIKEMLQQMLSLYEDKSKQNQIYLETVGEYFRTVLEFGPLKEELARMLRKNIVDIYMGKDFFKCKKVTLGHWKVIINSCTENYELLDELLPKEGLFQFLFDFSTKVENTKSRIRTFERVCFLIYSGNIDKYQNKLNIVLESLTEVMNERNPSPSLLTLLLFCIRILFIRLSQSSLNRLFRSIWPGLITLLYDLFTKQTLSKHKNLLLAGLKVIELVHALELEQFNLHKWIFIFDYFGIKIDPSENQKKEKSLIASPFKFKPILTWKIPQYPIKCTFIPEPLSFQAQKLKKRKLIVKQSSIDSEEDLKNHAFMLLQYMMDLNERKVELTKKQIEDVIEADFISLGDDIFQD